MSDPRLWLEDWCPRCSAGPGRRCRVDFGVKRRGPAPRLHIARGYRKRRCPTCKAYPGEPCRTPSGRDTSRPHEARLRSGADELVTQDQVWEQLEHRGVRVAVVRFSGCSGRGGRVERTSLSLLVDARRVEKLLRDEDELACALAAPAWDRYGAFAGHPVIRAVISWTVEGRIVISGVRGRQRFEEIVG